jgi:hypothetical protein
MPLILGRRSGLERQLRRGVGERPRHGLLDDIGRRDHDASPAGGAHGRQGRIDQSCGADSVDGQRRGAAGDLIGVDGGRT